jgi:hypothetical protein
MDKRILVFSFITIYLFLVPVALAQIPELPEFKLGVGIPSDLANLLESFGVPRELSIDYGLLLIYVIVPMITFIIILKAILVDQVMVNLSPSFSGAMGWIFCILVIIFLLPTGLIGAVAMMLYALSGIVVIYGFGFLIMMEGLNYVTKSKPWWWKFIILGIVGFFISLLFFPSLGLLIGLIIVAYSIFRAWRARANMKAALLGLKPLEGEIRKANFERAIGKINRLIKKLPSNMRADAELKYIELLEDAGAKYISNAIDEAAWKKHINSIEERIKAQIEVSKRLEKS